MTNMKFSLFKKKDDAVEADYDEPVVAEEKIRGNSVMKLSVMIAFVSLVVVLAAGAVIFLQYQANAAKQKALVAETEGDAIASHIAGRVAAIGKQVENLASTDTTADMFLASDKAALNSRIEVIKTLFPKAVRVRFVTPDVQDPDRSTNPVLGYACLDLVRHAENEESLPPIEVHLFGNDDQHMDVVRPVPFNGKVIASLLVSFDVKTIRQWLREATADKGYVELAQTGAGSTIVATAGDSSLKQGKHFMSSIAGTTWELTFWKRGAVELTPVEQGIAIATVVGAGIAVFILILIGGVIIRGAMKHDLDQFVNYMVEVLSGQRHHSLNLKMVETQVAYKQLNEALPDEGPSSRQTRSVSAPPPDLLFNHEGMSVEEVDDDNKSSS